MELLLALRTDRLINTHHLSFLTHQDCISELDDPAKSSNMSKNMDEFDLQNDRVDFKQLNLGIVAITMI